MKRMTFLLFFISPFCLSMAFAQSTDIALFDDSVEQVPCPTCQKRNSSSPNIGNDAEPVDTIRFAPPPFPAIKVTMQAENPLPEKPFSGAEMKYEKNKRTNVSSSEGLSAPVDFSKQSIQKTTSDKISVFSKKQENKTVSKAASITKKENKTVPKEASITKKENKVDPKPIFNSSMPVPKKNQISSIRADVNTFNVADLYLTMSPEDVIDVAADNGFEIANVAYGIPSFMVTEFEKYCRDSGLYQTRLMHECIREKAKDEDVYYISQLLLKRADTKEQIVVLFSSTLSGNQAFKIDYTGFGDNSLGTSYKDLLKKTNRRDVFWKYVYEKYGKPTSSEAPIWGSLDGISLRAFLDGNALNARIILQNFDQKGKDYRLAEEWSNEQEVENPFNF